MSPVRHRGRHTLGGDVGCIAYCSRVREHIDSFFPDHHVEVLQTIRIQT